MDRHGQMVKHSLDHWLGIYWLACRVLAYKHKSVWKPKSLRVMWSSCICRYVMFAFITKETLNNNILIFPHHKSMKIELIKIIMDVIVSPKKEQSWPIDIASISTFSLMDVFVSGLRQDDVFLRCAPPIKQPTIIYLR